MNFQSWTMDKYITWKQFSSFAGHCVRAALCALVLTGTRWGILTEVSLMGWRLSAVKRQLQRRSQPLGGGDGIAPDARGEPRLGGDGAMAATLSGCTVGKFGTTTAATT
jgi:hypothetical protein